MILTPRWTQLKWHPEQERLSKSTARFKVVPAGRRSGKTEHAKRFLIEQAITFHKAMDGRFIFSAPTTAQAREIFWEDAKAMIPDCFLLTPKRRDRSIFETSMTIRLWNGARIQVIGMDRAERAEGSPIDGIVLDEYGNMKPDVWTAHIRPALSTIGRPGWAWFIGVPEGRNHYYHLFKDCDRKDDWESFTWTTASINPEEAEAAKEDLDPQTYSQEYDGRFITFEGRAYYAFDRSLHCPPDGKIIPYNPKNDLYFCFDFNSKPGVAVVAQEVFCPDWLTLRNGGYDPGRVSAAIDEVFIPRHSNTYEVCDKLIDKYGDHKGDIHLYGDASGGQKKADAVSGSCWDLVMEKLNPVFGNRIYKRVPSSNPTVRSSINDSNTRFRNAKGHIHAIANDCCKRLIDDWEGVAVSDDGKELQKGKDEMLSHISDAWRYYVSKEHPCRSSKVIWSNK